MKTKLFLLLTLFSFGFGYSQVTFSNISSGSITNTSAIVTGSTGGYCANGGDYGIQYALNNTFDPVVGSVAGFGWFTATPPGAKSFSLTNLIPNRTYYWRFYGSLGSGCDRTVGYSNTYSFTTTAIGKISYSNLTSNVTSATTASVSASIDGACSTGAAYTIEYATLPNLSTGLVTTNFTASTTPETKTFNITGLAPNTTYYWRVIGGLNQPCVQSTEASPMQSFTTSVNIKNLNHQNVTGTSANVIFDVQNLCTASEYQVQYAKDAAFTTPLIAGNAITSACSTTAVPNTVSLTGLDYGVVYYYRVMSKFSTSATWDLSETKSFFTGNIASGLLQHFKFNNSYTNEAGNISFTTAALTTDRSNIANSALSITFATQSQAVIPNLPYGNSPRTFSFWAKNTQYSTFDNDPVFTYGASGNACGGAFSEQRAGFFGDGVNGNLTVVQGFGQFNFVNTWYHFVMVYDGTDAKIYRNGEFFASLPKTWNTLNDNDIFKLGISITGQKFFTGAIDELRIYNRAITVGEIKAIYNEPIVYNVTPKDNSTALVKAFPFDFSAFDQDNTVQFATSNATFPITYVADRNNVQGSAMATTASATRDCLIPNIPLGTSDRSISFWFKTPGFAFPGATLFTYGSETTYENFGISSSYVSGSFKVAFLSSSYASVTTAIIPENSWNHLVAVFNNATKDLKIYLNGTNIATINRPLLNTTLNFFKIGGFNGAIDDLKIYNRAITDPEVFGLLLNNNLTVPTPIAPEVTNISSVPSAFNSKINYTVNANFAPTTTIIRYGTSSGNLNNQITGINTSGLQTLGESTITGLQSSTQYFYQIEVTNSVSTFTSPVYNFTTISSTVAQYTFNNTLANVLGTEPFSATNTTYTANRNNVANSALSIAPSAGTSATITGLPIGASPRTISFWYRVATNVDNSTIFTYGTTGASRFGMYIQSTGRPVFWSSLAEPVFGTGSFAANTWHHAVLTYDGTNVSIYINGAHQATKAFAATTVASVLNFANASTVLSLDDLQIFSVAYDQAGVTSLYTGNTLGNDKFNQNNSLVSLYPNPVKDILHIETTGEIKSVTVYGILGNQVLTSTSKDVNVTNLKKGVYLVRIQDADNKVSTKKIIKE